MRTARELLRLLTIALPPREGAHHALVFLPDQRLEVVLIVDDCWESYVLDEADLDLTADTLALEILSLRKRANDKALRKLAEDIAKGPTP